VYWLVCVFWLGGVPGGVIDWAWTAPAKPAAAMIAAIAVVECFIQSSSGAGNMHDAQTAATEDSALRSGGLPPWLN
jgi:hypothetical protein